ncbi:la-related protein 7-like [Battus philenor]|uniref:la-related protein 7-like n=1 Tax=Battus philenor TaxID=42288 RepID=UPI0035D0EE25
MSESETVETVDQDAKLESNHRKRVRHRKRQLYGSILKQIEFYFSDANLSKDRFFNELLKNDPYVSVCEFLKFNRIRSMTQDVHDIVKALTHSTTLQLSEDKLKVKRKALFVPYDADARTVYVESIPVKATQEWLEKVFSDYGHVAYISLPKFKNSQKIKGFGFIEYSKPQEAQKCINAFTKMGCKLPICMPPEELSSIKMFSVNEELPQESNESKSEYEPPKKKNKKGKDKKKSLELKLDQDSDSDRHMDTSADGKTTDAESRDEITSQDESKNEQETSRKKKTKKRKKKNSSKDKNKSKTDVQNGLWGLQVLPKKEWKALRNKYLNLQRKNFKEFRAKLHTKKDVYTAIPASAAPSLEGDSAIKIKGIESSKIITPLERISGVFVEEVLPEPCLDVRLTKRTIKSNIHAQHVEAKEGQTEVIIRFDSAKAADEYCTNSNNRARVLSGAEEQEQWIRAEASRAAGKSQERRARVGRHAVVATVASSPILAPASPQPTHTHIRFDE